jgi:ribosome-binding protein aMBF1 (putative translation factor)
MRRWSCEKKWIKRVWRTIHKPAPKNERSVSLSPQRSAGRVALLGFAYRHISVKFTQKTTKPSQPKPLPARVKTMADWIAVKLHEKGIAPYHLSAKMGIASSVVNVWKEGKAQPKACHIREMVKLLGKYSPQRNIS